VSDPFILLVAAVLLLVPVVVMARNGSKRRKVEEDVEVSSGEESDVGEEEIEDFESEQGVESAEDSDAGAAPAKKANSQPQGMCFGY
jgi:Ran GTPase-activating protein (RanGAP) involved in mRNA processing and transport